MPHEGGRPSLAVVTRSAALALFDVDGTLIRAGDPEHGEAFVLAAAEVHGVDVHLDGIPLGGRLDRDITADALRRAGVTDHTISSNQVDLMAAMGHHYRRLVGVDARRSYLLPGVAELLERCPGAGIAAAVVTGGASTLVPHKLAAAGLAVHLPVLACGDEAHDRAALVTLAVDRATQHWAQRFERTATVVIGDTPLDIEAARVAGTRCLAVATGRWSIDELAGHAPDWLLPDLADTELVLTILGGRLPSRDSGGAQPNRSVRNA